VLILVAVVSALGGIAVSAVSNCCGSPDPTDPTAAWIGIGVAAAMSVASIGLWTVDNPRKNPVGVKSSHPPRFC
jgi:hypothetical protein